MSASTADSSLKLAVNELISTCKSARECTSSKERKELLSKLINLLNGNGELLRTLDTNTQMVAMKRGDRSKAITWTFVINTYFKVVESELLVSRDSNAVGKKASLTKMGVAIRDVCRLADRRGRHLFGVIDSVFAHLLEVLEGHMDVFGSDYTHLLMDLFAVEAYSNTVRIVQFVEMLQVFVTALIDRTPLPLVAASSRQAAARANSSAVNGTLSAMQLYARVIHHLLQHYRADLTSMAKSLAEAFTLLLTRIQRVAGDEDDDFDDMTTDTTDEVALQHIAQVQWQRAERAYGASGRMSLLSAMATVAMRCAPTSSESLFWTPRLAALVAHAWPSVRAVEHKLTLIRFAHVQLRVAVPLYVSSNVAATIGEAPMGSVGAVRRCFDAEMERIVSAMATRRPTNVVIWSGCYANVQRSADDEMSRRLLAFGADLYLYCEHVSQSHPAAVKTDPAERSSAKKPRVLTPIGELRSRALVGGAAALPWLQLLHALLLQLPDSVLGDCVGRLSLSAIVDELCVRIEASPQRDECFWLLACLQRAMFAAGAIRVAASIEVQVSRARCGARAWSAIARHIGELGDEEQRGALVVLATLLEMQHVDSAAIDEASLIAVFGLSAFDIQRAKCDREHLRFVLALLERTSLIDSIPKPESIDGAPAMSWRQRLLLWLVTGASFTVPENVTARTAMSAAMVVDSFVDVHLWSRVFVSLHAGGICGISVPDSLSSAGGIAAVSPTALRSAQMHNELALVDVPWQQGAFIGESVAPTNAPLADDVFGVDSYSSTSVRFDGDLDYERLRASFEDDQLFRDLQRTRPLFGQHRDERRATLPPLSAQANAMDHTQRLSLAEMAKTAFHSLVERALEASKRVLANKRRTLGIDETSFLMQQCHAVHLVCAASLISGAGSPCAIAVEQDAELLLKFVCEHIGELTTSNAAMDLRILSRFCALLTQMMTLASTIAALRPALALLSEFVHRVLDDVSSSVIGSATTNNGAPPVSGGAFPNELPDDGDGQFGGDLDEDFAQQAATSGVSSASTVTTRQQVALIHECLATIGARGADTTYAWSDGVEWISNFLGRMFDSNTDVATRLWAVSLSGIDALMRQRAPGGGNVDEQRGEIRASCLGRLHSLLVTRRIAPAVMCALALQQLECIATDMRKLREPEERTDVKRLDECAHEFFADLTNPQQLINIHIATRRSLAVLLQGLLRIDKFPSFGEILDAFLDMHRDADIGVRLCVARDITLFFDVFESEREILADIRKHMHPVGAACTCADANACSCALSASAIATTLLTLAQIARVSEINRTVLVAEFVLWCSQPQQLGQFARYALTWLAGRLEATPPTSSAQAHHVVARLLQRNIPAILDRFVPLPLGENEARVDLRSFPFDLCAPDMNMPQFAATYAADLLQRLTLARDKEQIERLASTLSLTTEALLGRHFGAVFGAAMPLYFVRDEVSSRDKRAATAATNLARLGADVCERFLPALMNGEASKFVPSQMPVLLSTLLDLCQFPEPPADADAESFTLTIEVAPGNWRLPPQVMYSAAVIKRAFVYLSDSFNSPISRMLFKGEHSDRVHITTMHMRYRMAAATTSLEQIRCVRALALFDGALESEALRVWTFLELANFYFDALLLSKPVQEVAAASLLALCRRAAGSTLATLESQLPKLVANLLVCAPLCANARACLRFLVIDCEAKLEKHIGALPGFARQSDAAAEKDFDTMMLQLAAVHERVSHELADEPSKPTASAKRRRRESSAVGAKAAHTQEPLNELHRMLPLLLERVSTDSPDAATLASLRAVASVLDVDATQLRTLIETSSWANVHRSAEFALDIRTLLQRVTLQLVALVSTVTHRDVDERNSEILQLATTMLGHLRSFDPDAVAFASGSAAASGAAFVQAVANSPDEPLTEYLRLIFTKLIVFLQRRDAVLVRMSGAVLAALLRSTSGKRASQLLTPEQLVLLSPFINSRASQRWRDEMRKLGVDVDARTARYMRLDGRALPAACPISVQALWTVACGGAGNGGSGNTMKSFDDWIRMLAYSLTVGSVKDEALSTCAELCLYSAEFAEFCMPAILFDTCISKTVSKESQKRIARSVVRIGLDADEELLNSSNTEALKSAEYRDLLACVRNPEFVDAPAVALDEAEDSLVDIAPLDDYTFTQSASINVTQSTQRFQNSILSKMSDTPSVGPDRTVSAISGHARSAVARQSLLLLDLLSVLFRVNHAMLKMAVVRSSSASQSRVRTSANGLWEQIWSSPFWYGVECDRVARCAVRHEALCTALFFNELHRERKLISEDAKLKHEQSIALLTEVFSRISDPDSLYAVVHESDSFDGRDHILLGAHERDWPSVAAAHDRALLHGVDRSQHATGLCDALRHNAQLHLMRSYLCTVQPVGSSDAASLAELQAECAWRTGRWTYDAVPASAGGERRVEFQQSLHSAAIAFEGHDVPEFDRALRNMRAIAARQLSLTSVESSEHLYMQLQRLACANELERVWRVRANLDKLSGASSSSPALRGLLDNYAKDEASIAETQLHQFDAHEPLLSLRTMLLPRLRAPPLTVIERHLSIATLAQQAARSNVAIVELFAHRQLCVEHNAAPPVLLRGALAEANVRWLNGDRMGAIALAQQLVRRLGASDLVRIVSTTQHDNGATDDALPRDVQRQIASVATNGELAALLGDTLTSCGRWLGETHMASGVQVKRHLRCAVALYRDGAPGGLASAHITLAEYVDRRYQALEERIASSAWLASQRLKKAKRDERDQYLRMLSALGAHENRQRGDLKRTLEMLSRQVELDTDETESVIRERNRALIDAVTEYGAALQLQADSQSTQAAFRLASLWFAAQQLSGDVPGSTSDVVASIVPSVPARTFLPLVYQLASRLSQKQADEASASDGGRFQRTLQSLLFETARRLPVQSLWTLIALSNGARVPEDQRSKQYHVIDQEKIDAAHSLLRRLRQDARLKAILGEMDQLVDAYIDFAFVKISKSSEGKPQLDVTGLLLGVPELSRVAVPTLPLSLTEEEELAGAFVYVAGFPKTFRTAGGINVPKIIECIGSDGREYRQLVKGTDDLRQDMVMQQTFAMCNALLCSAAETRRRCLRVGTYRVVPLTPAAGLLQWCTNTMPLGAWIDGDRQLVGARRRYRPGDMTRTEAREIIEHSTPQNRRREYDRVCEKYLPVFRYFFLENFASAAEWFTARLAYTRSVAASSIVGNAVGLGDRHSQNILVNIATAELTHIDLGVAFEQGMTLRVPEIVPFRLSREIVDGMGATGVAGTFTRCCEATASVLKRSQTLILTVLEVLLHDPLYRWALSLDEALRLQTRRTRDVDGDADEQQEPKQEAAATTATTTMAVDEVADVNKDAARALLRCRQKLQCVVGGELLSVEGYVSQLIAEARDEDRLSKMFVGWAAYS